MSDQEDAVIPDYAQPLIDAEEVQHITKDCLATSEETAAASDEVVFIEGIAHTYPFHTARLAKHKLDVAGMLVRLPLEFRPVHMGGGGGWSFLNACNDASGEQWTGFHQTVESLLVLGIAMGLVEWLLPKDMWEALPGGMPYVAVKV